MTNTEANVISILGNLEADVKNVLNASIPNKVQNRAASVLISDHFQRANHLYKEAIGYPNGFSKLVWESYTGTPYPAEKLQQIFNTHRISS